MSTHRALSPIAAIWAAALVLVFSLPSAAKPLVIDLSERDVDISVGFDGTELLMFGALSLPDPEAAFDLFVTVLGPAQDIRVRRKERVLGLWINRDSAVYRGIPGFYKSFSARPLDATLTPALREAVESTGFGLLQGQSNGIDFDRALIRQMEARGLFERRDDVISFLSNQLFRADITLPSNVPTGTYTIRVVLTQDGKTVFNSSTPLNVRKVGTGAWIFRFAQNYGLLYGIVAVLVALLMGYLSYAVFNRR